MAKRITTKYEELIEIEDTAPEGDDLAGYYIVVMRGLCQHMTSDAMTAIFGTFERAGRGLVEYSATVWAENGEIFHDYHSEFLDDLAWLQAN